MWIIHGDADGGFITSINWREQARVIKLKENKHENIKAPQIFIYYCFYYYSIRRILQNTNACLHIQHPNNHICIYLVFCLTFNIAVHGGNIRPFSGAALTQQPAFGVFFSFWKQGITRSFKLKGVKGNKHGEALNSLTQTIGCKTRQVPSDSTVSPG